MTTKGGRKALLSFAGALPKDAEIAYTREGKPKISFAVVVSEATKKRADGTWPQGASVWFNMEAWPSEEQASEWMPLLKKGAAITVFNASLSISTGTDGKVWQNWRVNMYDGIFVDCKATAPAAAATSSSGQGAWQDIPDDEPLTDPE